MFSTLFWPVFPFLMQCVFAGYWAVSVVYPFKLYILYFVWFLLSRCSDQLLDDSS